VKWVSKKSLEIQIADLKARLEAALISNIQLSAVNAKLERLIDHERERIDSERARADRATDALLQSDGKPPITDEGVAKSEIADSEAEKKFAEQQRALKQAFSEAMDDMESDDELVKQLSAEIVAAVTPEIE